VDLNERVAEPEIRPADFGQGAKPIRMTPAKHVQHSAERGGCPFILVHDSSRFAAWFESGPALTRIDRHLCSAVRPANDPPDIGSIAIIGPGARARQALGLENSYNRDGGSTMLILFRGKMTKPYGMDDSEYYGVWLQEARAALEAKKVGAIQGIWKVAGKQIVIGIIDVPDAETFDSMLMQLPVYAKGYSFLNELEYDILADYENWAALMAAQVKQ
jgi:muconolactone delta-isomerase